MRGRYRFSESCPRAPSRGITLKKRIERDDDSKKSHHALTEPEPFSEHEDADSPCLNCAQSSARHLRPASQTGKAFSVGANTSRWGGSSNDDLRARTLSARARRLCH